MGEVESKFLMQTFVCPDRLKHILFLSIVKLGRIISHSSFIQYIKFDSLFYIQLCVSK